MKQSLIAEARSEHPNDERWHTRSADEGLSQLGSSTAGLSSQDAAHRLAVDGPNDLEEGNRISPLWIFLGQFKSLIIWILIAAGALAGVLGAAEDEIHRAVAQGT